MTRPPTAPASRTGSARDLLRPTVRSTPWGSLLFAGTAAVALVLSTVAAVDLPIAAVVDRVRIAAVLLAVGVAGVLGDPTRPDLDVVPMTLALRQSLRLVVAGTVTMLFWALSLLAAAYHPAILRSGHRGGVVPVAELTVVLAALVAVTLATAALATRRRGGTGTVLAAAAAVTAPAVALVAPRLVSQSSSLEVSMFPPYGGSSDALWLAAHQRWAVIAVAAAVLLGWALRDPGRPRGRGRPPGAAGSGRTAALVAARDGGGAP